MNIEKTISDLTECYRLIGATQAKIGFGIFTQEDSRFLSAMYEAVLRHEKAIRAENESLIEELNEQARLLGISAEKELALLAKVGHLEMERDRLMKGEYVCKRCGLRKDNKRW